MVSECTMSSFSFDTNKISFGEARIWEGGPVGRCKFVPISYDGECMLVVTPTCFSWGLQRDGQNPQGGGYKVPLVMVMENEEHREFVLGLEKVIEKCREKYSICAGVDKIGSCLYKKEIGRRSTQRLAIMVVRISSTPDLDS